MITPTNPNTHPRREFGTGQRLDRVLIGAAIGWGVVILILAIVYPIESINTGRPGVQPMRSLVAVHGYGVLPAAAIPLLIAIVVGLLHVTRPRARWATTTAWILSGALLLASLAGFATFLIGIYVLPTGALLIVALAQATSGQRGTASASAPHHR
jgi:uncharacterized membrane protein YccC